jgi:hypothetical protein
MTTWTTAAVVSVATLALATASAAQDELSARERRYASALARELGSSEHEVRRIQVEHGSASRVEDAANMGGSVPAILVHANDTTVARLRFETPEQAQAYANRLLTTDLGASYTGQLRGNQLVIVQGHAVHDPATAKRLTEAAWRGLPAPEGAPEAAFTQLADGTIAVSTTLDDGPLRESIDKTLAAARARDRANDPDDGITVTEDTAEVALPSGLRAGVQVDEQGASFFTSRTPDGLDAAKEHLAALGGHPGSSDAVTGQSGAAAATEGAAKILEDLFR